MNPEEVLTLLNRCNKKTMYVVCHKFENLYGTMHIVGNVPESKYQVLDRDGKLVVHMQVEGNYTGYTHDPCFWLQSTYYSGSNGAMAWGGYQIGDSWILKFRPAPKGLIIDSTMPMSLLTSLNRNDHYGNVSGVLSLGDENGFKPMLEVMKVANCTIKSFGTFVWVSKNTGRNILLPKDIVKAVAFKMVGCPRDKAGLRLCVNTMKLQLSKEKMSISNDMRLDCAIHGSAMAFIYALEDEIIAFNQLCQPRYKRFYKMLTSVLNLEKIDFCCLPCGKNEALNACVAEYDATRNSLPVPTFDAAKAWPEGLPGVECVRALVERKDNSRLSKGSSEKIEDKPQFYPVCMTFSNYIPVVPYASINNETIALNNRALMITPHPCQQAWDKVIEHGTKILFDNITTISGDIREDFNNWNDRFPKGRASNQSAAFETLFQKEICTEDYTRKAFVKRELTMKGGMYEEFDPRCIQAGSHRLNSALGPFMYKFSKQLAGLWNAENNICYTSGMNGEEIGKWRAQFDDLDVTIVEIDESRYDAHQGEAAFNLQKCCYVKAGIDDYFQAGKALDSMKCIMGYSSKGVKYKVDYTMTSGSATTSCGNSIINGVKTSYVLESFGIRNYKMLVHGDDNLVVIPGVMSERSQYALKQFIKMYNVKLGFETKVKISTNWSRVEYCSSLFWPTEDGYVLGPKIGKRLPKVGFSLRKLDVGEVKGMLLGLRIEAGFVPVIRTYTNHNLKLLKNVGKKEYFDDRRIYKSLPTATHRANDATNDFFLDRYGLTVEEAECELVKLFPDTLLTSCVNYSFMDVFTSVDL